MLRFNPKLVINQFEVKKFQYILCYGSTTIKPIDSYFKKDFNTSYVTVQQYGDAAMNLWSLFQYILCYGSTVKCFSVVSSFPVFQYILCYGSTGKAAQP